MQITVCQLHNDREGFLGDWDRLVRHVSAQRGGIVLLPEMPFSPWFPAARNFDAATWRDAVAAHDAWERRLAELAPATAVGTRPVDYGDGRYAAGFMWNQDEDIIETIHVKSRLCSEKGAWETSWYESAIPDFEVATVASIHVGMLIGMELWLSDQAKLYGEEGAQIIAVPMAAYSADAAAMDDAWLARGRAAAEASGAYCVASSRGTHANSVGSSGWIIAPDGHTVAITSPEQPMVTAEIDVEPIASRSHGAARSSEE
jgi:predicted amidohydrolase